MCECDFVSVILQIWLFLLHKIYSQVYWKHKRECFLSFWYIWYSVCLCEIGDAPLRRNIWEEKWWLFRTIIYSLGKRTKFLKAFSSYFFPLSFILPCFIFIPQFLLDSASSRAWLVVHLELGMFSVPPLWFCAFGWLYYPFWDLSPVWGGGKQKYERWGQVVIADVVSSKHMFSPRWAYAVPPQFGNH